jgi:hypothetical protein
MPRTFQLLDVIIIVVGLLGFVNNPILGLFGVNGLHKLVHIVTGAALLYAGLQGGTTLRLIAQVFGVVYLLVFILGLVASELLNSIIPNNAPDTALHALLALLLLHVGFMASRTAIARP